MKKLRKITIFLLIVSWFLTGWPQIWQNPRIPPKIQEAQAAVAKAGTNTSGTSTSGTNTTLSFSHTLVSGSNRIVVVSVGQENNGNSDVTSVTYGGTTMTTAVEQATGTSGYIMRAEIWYLLESDLAAMGDGSKTVVVTVSAASSSEINALAAEYVGVNQGVPEATAALSSTAKPIVNTISPSDDAWVISAVGCGNKGTYTHGQSQVELLDANDGSSGFAVAELQGANGETSLDSTFSATVNRQIRVAASFTPIVVNNPPSLTVSQPDGASDTVIVGQSYNITYDLSDSDSVATVDFYYDSNGSGLDGTAIADCQNQAEGTGATCSWDTTGMTPGDYYVYGIASDGVNEVNDYSPGVITIQSVVYSVAISPGGTISYGTIVGGQSKSTIDVSATQTATNDGNATEKLNIKTSNATGGTGWAIGSSPGSNIFVHEFSTNDGGAWTKFTTADSYQTLATGVTESESVDFDLRITVPTDSDSQQKSITITVQAVAP